MNANESDRQVLAAMASHGADLTKPTHTVHFLYFSSMESARDAADKLQAEGFDNVRTHRSPPANLWERFFGPKLYSCIAEKHVIPSEDRVFSTTAMMNDLADQYGGTYDGWEASIEQ